MAKPASTVQTKKGGLRPGAEATLRPNSQRNAIHSQPTNFEAKKIRTNTGAVCPLNTMNNSRHFTHLSFRFALGFIGALAFTQTINAAETPSTAIPFNQLGAKATADYHGDAIGINKIDGGARLHTGFQKLSGTVTSNGLQLISTDDKGGELRLIATAIGKAKLPTHGKVVVGDKVISFNRPGLTEEYSVSVDGVRQDFIVLERLTGGKELSLTLDLTGAKAETATYGVTLALTGSGRHLAYSRLRVVDATGRELPARMEVVTSGRLAVHVADTNAVYPVRIDPTFSDANWVSLNSGIPGTNGTVNATVVDGSGNLYIGGSFTFVGSVAAINVAKWNGSAWSALGSGLTDAEVRALAVSGSTLYVGGAFTTIGGVSAKRVARWNGTAWSALAQGIDPALGLGPSVVHALAVSGATIYAGGEFTTAGAVSANRIAQWGGSAWSALSNGVPNGVNPTNVNDPCAVYALAVSGTDLFVGGVFGQASGAGTVSNIAKWNGTTFSGFTPSGTTYCAGFPVLICTQTVGAVLALAVSGTDLYVGGGFNRAGSVDTIGIAKWNGSVWSALGSGIDPTGTPGVSALAVSGANVYVGGDFAGAGGVGNTLNIAKWNGSAWSQVVDEGPNAPVLGLAFNGSLLYVGGSFTVTRGFPADHIAKVNGTIPSSLTPGMNGDVLALALNGTDVYVGGSFLTAANSFVNHVAKWNGSVWSPVGDGTDDTVRALLVNGPLHDVYAGGNFLNADSLPANHIAKWNGSSWSALGLGTDGTVYALAADGSTIYACGAFANAGGNPAGRVARWIGGTWSQLGGGFPNSPSMQDNTPYALAVISPNLYVGGAFQWIEGSGGPIANTSRIAKWNANSGGVWSAVGTGTDNTVNALVVSGTRPLCRWRLYLSRRSGQHQSHREMEWQRMVGARIGDERRCQRVVGRRH